MRRLKLIVPVISLWMFSSCSEPSNTGASSTGSKITGLQTEILEHGGLERKYLLYQPKSYDGTNEVPLIFNFHGYGDLVENYIQTADMRALADTKNFILVYPQGALLGKDPHWNAGLKSDSNKSQIDDFGFIIGLLDKLSAKYKIDSKRVYAAGYSNGGFFAYALACFYSSRFAAIGSVASTMMEETYDSCRPEDPTGIIHIHGTSDYVVPYGGGKGLKGIDDTLSYWSKQNKTTQGPNSKTAVTSEGITIEYMTYTGGEKNSSVDHYKVIGGGHIWNDKLSFDGKNTSALIVDFFLNHSLLQ